MSEALLNSRQRQGTHRRISHDTCNILTNEVSTALSSPVGLHEIGEDLENEGAFISLGRVELTKDGKST